MKSYEITEFGGAINEVERQTPDPRGTEVLVRVTRAGVCHSDLHIADGFYDLGGGTKLDLGQRGISLPLAMGHEILGVVEKAGPDAVDAPIGQTRLVHPWLGCGECPVCKAGKENHCAKPQAMGVFRGGGYSEYCVVPDPKFLVDIGDLDPSVATPYACSGVTVFSALKKALPIVDGESLAIMGAGGLGLNAIAIAKAMGISRVISCDIDDSKLEAAKEMGADVVVNTSAPDALKQMQDAADGYLRAVVDTVGAEATATLGQAAAMKGGRYVIVGLFGGQITVSLPTLPLRALSIIGSYTGSLEELKELIALVQTGKVKPLPVSERPLAEVSQTLDDLRAGRIVGRVVLTN
ncbi:MAG: alcohol dehydrogenase catalytic domain-containing protein [Rhodospirillaceae bacterium]|jgi:D-arabinose 1-dehydrogenase-like Zn-dependent alcohol dehydrogenase|nr:alcohol dehydrogenase catalytic domain-containing protein [Rhodospirillaceae bacterium]